MKRYNHAGVKRLFSGEYEIEEALSISAGYGTQSSGRIIINSRRLKDFIGSKARIIVYIPRKCFRRIK